MTNKPKFTKGQKVKVVKANPDDKLRVSCIGKVFTILEIIEYEDEGKTSLAYDINDGDSEIVWGEDDLEAV